MAAEYPRVLAFARATTHSWSEAEDLTQEAFLAAYRKWDDVAHYDNPGAFVRRVVANKPISGGRARSRESAARKRMRTTGVIDPEAADPAFWASVQQLPPRQRHVVA